MAIAQIVGTGVFSQGATVDLNFISGLAAGSKLLMILSGQSNWRGHPLNTAYTGPLPTTTQVWLPGGWQLYTPDHHPEYVTPMSPTLGMVLEFEERYPDLVLYIIETGQGGQGFQAGNGVFAAGGAIRNKLVTYIADGIANLKAAGDPINCMGFSFFQGEKDSENTAWADAYENQLSIFLAALDAAAGIDLYKLITRIHIGVPIAAESTKVRAAHVALADSIINTDTYQTLPGDNLHFAPETYRLIGESYLDRLEKFSPTTIDADEVVTPPTPPAGPVTVGFRDFLRMEEFGTGSVRDQTPYGSGSLPKGATVDATFSQGEYVSCVADDLANNTSVIVILNSLDNQDYSANGGAGRLAGFNFKSDTVRTHPPMGSGQTHNNINHAGDGVVGRIAWVGDDAIVQTSDDDGATWNRTYRTFTGAMAGVSVAYCQVIQGFSGSVEKRLTDFRKGQV